MRRLAVLTFVLFLSLNSAAELPGTIGYQGRLTDETGVPINGALSMTFRLFQSRQGGDPLWTEVQSEVEVDEGYFSVSLGSVTPFNLDFKSQYFLEIQVEDDDPMSPRVKLEGVPYAERAAAAPRIVVTDANGDVIGDLLSLHSRGAVDLLSETGYVYAIKRISGKVMPAVADLYFESSGCVGDGFGNFYAGSSGDPDFAYAPGIVFSTGGSLYYVSRTAETFDGDGLYNSYFTSWGDGECVEETGAIGPITMVNVMENDPDITGVSQSVWPAPITIDLAQGGR